MFAAIALVAVRYGSVQGPEIKPLLPVVTTLWASADLLTAFLLLAQFCLTGSAFFSRLAAAYGFSGLLAWPYLLAFPNLFFPLPFSVPDQQTSIALWSVWHATFPLVVIVVLVYDAKRSAPPPTAITAATAWLTALMTTVCATVVAALVYAVRGRIPTLIETGHLQFTFTHLVAPTLVGLNIAGCAVIIRGGKRTPVYTYGSSWRCSQRHWTAC